MLPEAAAKEMYEAVLVLEQRGFLFHVPADADPTRDAKEKALSALRRFERDLAGYGSQIKRMASNARLHALREAADAVCPFCLDPNPWSEAQSLDGQIYEHFQVDDANNKRPCAATTIWKLIDAE